MSPRTVLGFSAVVAVLGVTFGLTESFLGAMAGVFLAAFLWNAVGLYGSSIRRSRLWTQAAARESHLLTEARDSSVWRAGDARTAWIVGSMLGHLIIWIALSLVQTRGELQFLPYFWVYLGFGPLPGLFVLLLCVFFTAFAVVQLNRATQSRCFRGPLVKANVCLSLFWLCQLLLGELGSYQGP